MSDDPSWDAEIADCAPYRSAVDQTLREQTNDGQVEAVEEGSWRDEVAESFTPQQDDWVIGQDGLPVPTNNPGKLQTAVVFTHEKSVCVEDDRMYVPLTRAEARDRVGGVAALVFGRSRYSLFGSVKARRSYPRDRVRQAFGVDYVIDRGLPVLVRPTRERCRHYMRQCWINDEQQKQGEFGHLIITRSCMARRSNGGAYLSVSNEGIYACEYRDPPDPGTLKEWLVDPDRKHLETEPDMVELWTVGKR